MDWSSQKELGDDAAKNGKWVEAIERYSNSITALNGIDDETLGTLYSNRSMCHLKYGDAEAARVDAEFSALVYRPTWPKAFLRAAAAHLALQEPRAAMFFIGEAVRLGGKQLEKLLEEATDAAAEEATTQDEMPAVLKACEAWGHGIGLSVACRIEESPRAGYGIFATEAMEEEAVIASIPIELAVADTGSCHTANDLDSPFLLLLLQLSEEIRPYRHGGECSEVGRSSYLHLLHHGIPASPLLFPRELLDNCGDPELSKEVERMREAVRASYMRLRASGGGGRGSYFGALEAMAVWYSRALPTGEGSSAVIPLVDMLNHEPNRPNAYVTFPPGAGTAEVRCACSVPAGTELRINYQSRRNRQWLLHFGFIPEANPEEAVTIALEAETSRICRQRLSACDLPRTMELGLRFDGAEWSLPLKAWLFIVTQEDTEEVPWGCDELEELARELSVAAWGVVVKSCEVWLAAQPPLREARGRLAAAAWAYARERRQLVTAAKVRFEARMAGQQNAI